MQSICMLLLVAGCLALPQSKQTLERFEPLEVFPEPAQGPELFEEPTGDEPTGDEHAFDHMPTDEVDYRDTSDNQPPPRTYFLLPDVFNFFGPRFRSRPLPPPWQIDIPRPEDAVPEPPAFDFFRPRPIFPREQQPHSASGSPFFRNFFDMFEPNFHSSPDFDSLPGNYSNSTHEVHDINGTKVMVNQTIEKKSGDNFHNFYHVKVISVLPNGEVIGPAQDVIVDAEPEIVLSGVDKNSFVGAETAYEIEPPVNYNENELVPESAPEAYEFQASGSNRQNSYGSTKRVGRKNTSKNSGNYLNWFNSGEKFDLSSDTRVNRIASMKQQGMSLVDPDAEVFDLGLVLREQDGLNE